MQKKTFRKGTLVYHYENGHFPVYVVISEHDGKFTLGLPWQPCESVLDEVDEGELEKVFSNPSPAMLRKIITAGCLSGDK